MQSSHSEGSQAKERELKVDSLSAFPCPALRIDSCGNLLYANSLAKSLANTLGINILALLPDGHARNIAHALTTPEDTTIAWPMTYGNDQILQWNYKTDTANQTVQVFATDVSRLSKATLLATDDLGTVQIPSQSSESIRQKGLSEDFLRLMPFPIAMLDTDMHYVAVSQAWVDAFHSDDKEAKIIGRNHYDCNFVPQILRATYRLALSGETKDPIETSYVDPENGRMEWIKSQAFPWHHEDGTIGGIMLLNEVTTGVRQEKAQEKKSEESSLWQKKLEALGTVSNGIAHEINSPAQYISDNLTFLGEAQRSLLQAIDVYRKTIAEAALPASTLQDITIFERSLNLPYISKECLNATEQARLGVVEISQIVNAIKTFSYSETHSPVSVNLNSTLEDTILVSKYRWKDIATVETDLDDKVQEIMGYPDQLGQVFLILIMNAIHAIEDQCKDSFGKIRISSQAYSNRIEINIDDNGVGIPPHLKNKIFDPYFTTKSSKRGSGQGLNTALKIIKDHHNGDITCRCDSQHGTRFTISLPC